MEDTGMDKVRITVKSIAGECQAGHCVGQEIVVDNVTLSGYLCPEALHSIWPWVQVLRFRGKFPWGDEDGVEIACPDAGNLVVFDVRRIKEEDHDQ
jgi:uncharacterized repeat protein (TIGR04076 family)